MRRLGAVLVAVLLLAVGAGAILLTPTGEQLSGPIAVPGTPGHAARGGAVAVTVDDVHLAQRLNGDPGTTTTGVWVVLDLTATGTTTTATFDASRLLLGSTSYTLPSDVTQGLLSTAAGIPTRGSLAFEVSRAALRGGAARTVLQVRTSRDRFPQSEPEIRMDLSGLTVEPSVDVLPQEVVSR